MWMTAVKGDKGSISIITEGAGLTKGSLQGVALEAGAGPEYGRSCGLQGGGHCVEKGGVAVRSLPWKGQGDAVCYVFPGFQNQEIGHLGEYDIVETHI